MAKRQMDDEDGLKRQARRRLIGAVALVTAVVVILPMVLDSEPRMAGQNIDLRIPDPDKVGEFKSQIVLPTEPPATASAPVAASAVAAPPTVVKSKPQVPVAKPEPVKPVKTAPSVTRQSKPVQKQPAPPRQGFALQVGAYSNEATVRRLKAKLLLQGWSVYTEKAGSSVRVRIGPYATRQEAEKDLHKLEAQKMHPALVTLN